MGRKSKKDGIYVYVRMIHFAVQYKVAQWKFKKKDIKHWVNLYSSKQQQQKNTWKKDFELTVLDTRVSPSS